MNLTIIRIVDVSNNKNSYVMLKNNQLAIVL